MAGRTVEARELGGVQARLTAGPTLPRAPSSTGHRRVGSPRARRAAHDRSQRAASSGSCVTTTSAVPASRLSSNRSASTVAPVSASRLPVGSSAKRSARAADEGAGERDALLLAARELRRVVVGAVAQPDAVEQVERRGPGAAARRAARAASPRSRPPSAWAAGGSSGTRTRPTARAARRGRPRRAARGRCRRAGRSRAWAGRARRRARAASSCRCRTARRWRTWRRPRRRTRRRPGPSAAGRRSRTSW